MCAWLGRVRQRSRCRREVDCDDPLVQGRRRNGVRPNPESREIDTVGVARARDPRLRSRENLRRGARRRATKMWTSARLWTPGGQPPWRMKLKE